MATKPKKTPTRKPTKGTAVAAETHDAPPPAAAKPQKKGEPAGGVLVWKQTSKDTWLADDPGGDKSKAGGRLKMSGQKWLHGPDADPIFFVYRDGDYLGTDTSLEAAQRRAQYREKSPSAIEDQVEGGGMPAFLNLTTEERRKHRGAMPVPARPTWGGGEKPPAPAAPAAPEDPALARAMAERAALAGASAASKAAKKAARREAKDAVRFGDDAVIKLLVDKNPRKPGTGAHARFALLMQHDGKTVREYKAAGGNMETLENAVKDGRASVAEKE